MQLVSELAAQAAAAAEEDERGVSSEQPVQDPEQAGADRPLGRVSVKGEANDKDDQVSTCSALKLAAPLCVLSALG